MICLKGEPPRARADPCGLRPAAEAAKAAQRRHAAHTRLLAGAQLAPRRQIWGPGPGLSSLTATTTSALSAEPGFQGRNTPGTNTAPLLHLLCLPLGLASLPAPLPHPSAPPSFGAEGQKWQTGGPRTTPSRPPASQKIKRDVFGPVN